jgi:flagellar motor switch protein FliM
MTEHPDSPRLQPAPAPAAAGGRVLVPLPPGAENRTRQAFEEFLSNTAALVAGDLNVPVEIRLSAADLRTLSEVLAETEPADCAVSLDLSPFQGSAYLILGGRFLTAALDTLLGAPAEPERIAREYLTTVDLKVVESLIDGVLGELRKAWQPICDASWSTLGLDVGGKGSGADADAGAAEVLVLTAEVVIHDCTDAFRLILPALFARAAGETDSIAGEQPRQLLANALADATFGVEAVLHASGIRIGDALRFKPGMVLRLPQKAGTPLECRINGVTKMHGEMIQTGDSVAFEVQSGAGTAAVTEQ